MRIFHIATVADWADARKLGSYQTSTRGRSLADEGFIHAANADQISGVFERYYRDAKEPLVLLTIDTARLDVDWREEQVGQESFPHIFGPLSTRAVVKVEPLSRRGRPQSLLQLAILGTAWRLGIALAVMLLAVACALSARAFQPDGWWPFMAACAGLAVGTTAAVALSRRRR